mgnify:CR=1 FL=1
MSSAVRRRVVELIDTSVLLNLLGTPFESDDAAAVGVELERRAREGHFLPSDR